MTDALVQAPIHKNWKTTLPRINNFYTSTRFQERNLVGRLYTNTEPVTLSYWQLPGGEGAWQNYSFDDIKNQTFEPVELGGSYGPTWTTHWFKVEYEIPAAWANEEVRFRWISGTEATIWSESGVVLQGLSSGTSQIRTDYVVTRSFDGTSASQVLYVEMAANQICGASLGDLIDPPDPNLYFTLTKAELAVMDRTVFNLILDLQVLYQIADILGEDNSKGNMALHSANQMVNYILEGNDTQASLVGEEFFSKGNGSRAHTLATIGNCHIDSAWLWPYSETKRKVARSFSAQLKLMEDYPEFIFVASQAQQWAWCKEYYLELFNRLVDKIQTGKFLPVGSTWTEMDGNIPSGESFIRQFFYGQKFFANECGYTCKEFWLPDTFGYNGQIPGLMKHVGLSRFLTKKLSWSMVNKFPHHNFVWEGIDGSTVLAHFPPGDSYHMNVTVEEAKKTEDNLEDKGRVSVSAFLFGYGDGGGGPTENMLERRRRLADVDGVPKMQVMTPDDLFTQLEAEQKNLMKWVGELFLELHNGTYTSQAAMKQLCRYAEFRLRDAEFMLSAAVSSGGDNVETLLTDSLETLETAWKKVLLNQFHDVLPGSAIEIVYDDAQAYYEEAIISADEVFTAAAASIFGSGTTTTTVLMNTLQWPRREVVEISSKNKKLNKKNKLRKGRAVQYAMVDVTSFGYNQVESVTPDVEVTVVENDGEFTMSNEFVTAKISSSGQVVSLILNGQTRDPFTAGESTGNAITLYDDEPLYWDAWDVMDYHLETAKVLNSDSSSTDITPVSILESGPLVGRLSWSLKISDSSTLTQEIILTAAAPYLIFDTTVDWHESHRILKANFDTNIFARSATYEIQFGYIERASHINTSWDSARYEVCGHKWADISEPDFGLTVLNDSKYGWEGRGSSLSLSLLKAPKAPDENCDMKTHYFKYAVMPHTGTLQEAEIVRRGYEFNNPLRAVSIPSSAVTSNPTWSLVDVEGQGIMLHTIKAADDASGDLILRLFEHNGCRSSSTITLNFICSAINETDGLEVTGGSDVEFTTDTTNQTTTFTVSLKPFNIYAVRLSL